MFSAKLVALLGATTNALDLSSRANDSAGDDASNHCLDNTGFCQRTREWKLD